MDRDFGRQIREADIEQLRHGLARGLYSQQKYLIVKAEVERRERLEQETLALRQVEAGETQAKAAVDTVKLAKEANLLARWAIAASVVALIIAALTFVFSK